VDFSSFLSRLKETPIPKCPVAAPSPSKESQSQASNKENIPPMINLIEPQSTRKANSPPHQTMQDSPSAKVSDAALEKVNTSLEPFKTPPHATKRKTKVSPKPAEPEPELEPEPAHTPSRDIYIPVLTSSCIEQFEYLRDFEYFDEITEVLM
jgi:hypothetical protein